jgi:hypothetical protein
MDLLDVLDHEWRTLAARRHTQLEYQHWQDQSPLLKRIPDLTVLIATIQRRGHPKQSDRLLAELAKRSPTSDLAARTLLQALTPALHSLVVAHQHIDNYDDVVSSAVTAMWERIRTYPIERRPRYIATNIVLDTRRHLRRLSPPRPAEFQLDDVSLPYATDDAVTNFIDAIDAANRVLSSDAVALLLRTRHAEARVSDIARACGQNANAIRERRRRAETRLALALGAAS